MEKLIKELMEKIVQKENKPELFRIFLELDELNLNSTREINNFIEKNIK